MRLNNQELYEFLIEKDMPVLFHANTVRTSLTFFEQNGLLSRGAVENKELVQTVQGSDEADKVLNVWNDVFLDSTDLHTFFRRQNYYGPILFEFDTSLILNQDYEIWITKNNPIYWDIDSTNETRYFQDMTDVQENWGNFPRQKKMITIRNNSTPILFDYLRRIVVDDPRINIPDGEGGRIHVANETMRIIKDSIPAGHPIRNKFTYRVCNNCWCRDNYLKQVSPVEAKRLFL